MNQNKLHKQALDKEVKTVTVALKSSKQEIKEILKTCNIERNNVESDIAKLLNYKHEHEKEANELRNEKRKTIKMERKEAINNAKKEVTNAISYI